MFQVSSLFGNALSLSAHEHINIQTIIIQKYSYTILRKTIIFHPFNKHQINNCNRQQWTKTNPKRCIIATSLITAHNDQLR